MTQLQRRLDYNRQRQLDSSNFKEHSRHQQPTEDRAPHAATSGNREDLEARRPADHDSPAIQGTIPGTSNRRTIGSKFGKKDRESNRHSNKWDEDADYRLKCAAKGNTRDCTQFMHVCPW